MKQGGKYQRAAEPLPQPRLNRSDRLRGLNFATIPRMSSMVPEKPIRTGRVWSWCERS